MKTTPVTVNLTDEQLAALRQFGDEMHFWHLSDRHERDDQTPHPIPDELSVLICLWYTAFGPERVNEMGAGNANPAEIDALDLVQAAKGWLHEHRVA